MLVFGMAFLLVLFSWNEPVSASRGAAGAGQLPTVDIPTVTSSPVGPIAFVLIGNEPQANLRSGPGALYDRVGVLIAGQSVPAKGRSPGGDWILVEYPGTPGGLAWIYSPLVEIRPATQLPIVEPPPTLTPVVTATIDPTLAARFVVTLAPTRLPTFTEPPPLVIPTFIPEGEPSLAGIPMGLIILGLAALGVFFGIMAFAQR
jgi:hypothetical protein